MNKWIRREAARQPGETRKSGFHGVKLIWLGNKLDFSRFADAISASPGPAGYANFFFYTKSVLICRVFRLTVTDRTIFFLIEFLNLS